MLAPVFWNETGNTACNCIISYVLCCAMPCSVLILFDSLLLLYIVFGSQDLLDGLRFRRWYWMNECNVVCSVQDIKLWWYADYEEDDDEIEGNGMHGGIMEYI